MRSVSSSSARASFAHPEDAAHPLPSTSTVSSSSTLRSMGEIGPPAGRVGKRGRVVDSLQQLHQSAPTKMVGHRPQRRLELCRQLDEQFPRSRPPRFDHGFGLEPQGARPADDAASHSAGTVAAVTSARMLPAACRCPRCGRRVDGAERPSPRRGTSSSVLAASPAAFAASPRLPVSRARSIRCGAGRPLVSGRTGRVTVESSVISVLSAIDRIESPLSEANNPTGALYIPHHKP